MQKERQRDHRPTTLTLTIGRGQRERSPPNLAYLNDRGREKPYLNYRRRQREREREREREYHTVTQPPSSKRYEERGREATTQPPLP